MTIFWQSLTVSASEGASAGSSPSTDAHESTSAFDAFTVAALSPAVASAATYEKVAERTVTLRPESEVNSPARGISFA